MSKPWHIHRVQAAVLPVWLMSLLRVQLKKSVLAPRLSSCFAVLPPGSTVAFPLALWVCRPPGIDFGVWFEARIKVCVIPDGDSVSPGTVHPADTSSPPTCRGACPQSCDGAGGSVPESCSAPGALCWSLHNRCCSKRLWLHKELDV